jgi:hypothetical protein
MLQSCFGSLSDLTLRVAVFSFLCATHAHFYVDRRRALRGGARVLACCMT